MSTKSRRGDESGGKISQQRLFRSHSLLETRNSIFAVPCIQRYAGGYTLRMKFSPPEGGGGGEGMG